MSEELKKDIVSNGGKKVNATLIKSTSIYQDENGKNYNLTDINSEVGLKYYNDNDKTVNGYIIYNGTVGNEYSYNTYSQYRWKRATLYNNYQNRLALSWQYNATPIGSAHLAHAQYTNSYGITYNALQNVTRNLLGTDIRVYKGGVKSNGFIREQLRIPISHQGNTGAFAIGYAQPYAPLNVTITYGPASITFDHFWGWRHTYIYNFTIGQ